MTEHAKLEITGIFVCDLEDEPSADFLWVKGWLARWHGQVRIIEYSSGGWEHCWKVEAPEEAIAEISSDLLADMP